MRRQRFYKNDETYKGKPVHDILPSITGPEKELCRRLDSNDVLQYRLSNSIVQSGMRSLVLLRTKHRCHSTDNANHKNILVMGIMI